MKLETPPIIPVTGVLVSDGSAAVTGVAPGSSGNVLTSNGSAWQSSALPSNVTEDMNGVWTAIDRNIGATNITNTTKQASPDWTYTILAGDIPSDSRVADWMLIITFGGKNNDSVTRTANAHFTLNGTEIGGSDAARSATTSLPYWDITGLIYGPITAGDVIGVKLWASSASVVDYRYATLYILPKTFALPASTDRLCMSGPIDIDSSNAIHGAATGVTYAFSDVLGSSDVAAVYGSTTGTDPGFASIAPTAVYVQNVTADNNSLNTGLAATPVLLGISRYRRYFHRVT